MKRDTWIVTVFWCAAAAFIGWNGYQADQQVKERIAQRKAA